MGRAWASLGEGPCCASCHWNPWNRAWKSENTSTYLAELHPLSSRKQHYLEQKESSDKICVISMILAEQNHPNISCDEVDNDNNNN